jgi:hypothetical protein
MLTDDEFVAIVGRAHQFRTDVANRGSSSADINACVWDRLYWKPERCTLGAADLALANQIHRLLTDWRLSQPQALELEGEFFPSRGRT